MGKLELFFPVKPYFLYQRFGDSQACTENTPNVPITQRRVVGAVNGVCPVGYVPLYPLLGMKGHTGEDMAAGRGMPVRAAHDGIVREVQLEPERGLGVGIITHERRDMGPYGTHYAKTRYWHLLSVAVQLGQEVRCGDILGYADSTGLSSGDHLHFELKPVEYKDDGFTYYNAYQDNGYFGAVDPSMFWSQKNGVRFYAEDFRSFRSRLDAIRRAFENLLISLKK